MTCEAQNCSMGERIEHDRNIALNGKFGPLMQKRWAKKPLTFSLKILQKMMATHQWSSTFHTLRMEFLQVNFRLLEWWTSWWLPCISVEKVNLLDYFMSKYINWFLISSLVDQLTLLKWELPNLKSLRIYSVLSWHCIFGFSKQL